MTDGVRDDETQTVTAEAPASGSTSTEGSGAGAVPERGVRLADRYRIVRLVGRGGMGVVYEAIDEARAGLRVALKLLMERQPNALYRLKNEFRALAETVHPNLVGLHGLGVDAHGWFVVMDLIEPSMDFLTYVRRAEGPFDEARLRAALAQLLRGVSALHAAGKLHRDLKPHNVLVTGEGRVVIVDFGLVGEVEAGGTGRTVEGLFAGTPAYAAPEQALGEAVGPRADLYAVGSMLFEALTGRLPFEGSSAQALLERKVREHAPHASALAQGVPSDLAALCARLLERDPNRRPDAEQALQELGQGPAALELPGLFPFVSRTLELAALSSAQVRARDGAPVVVAIKGPSGIGKTALITRFVELAQQREHVVVLKSRCHTHERVPFNALDPLLDALGRHLLRLPPVEAASLMPRDVALLTRLFPTLLRVPAVRQMPWGTQPEVDGGLLRARAFVAFKELLARLADRVPLILCVDDLQWADDDSKELLCAALSAPSAPSCLFLAALRETGAGEDARARASAGQPEDERRDERAPAYGAGGAEELLSSAFAGLAGVHYIELRLGPLTEKAATELTRAMLGEACSELELQLVVSEAAGSPFLLKELGRAAGALGATSDLRETVRARIAQLEPDARELVELVCLAARPLELGTASRAVQASPTALPAVLASALLRTDVRRGRELLESCHDRIRDAVVAEIEPARQRSLHLKLAQQLECEEQVEPELVARHYRAAERAQQAAPYLIAAGEHAARVFAFGRAIELYQMALAEAPASDSAKLELEIAELCARSGRHAEAADHYQRVLRDVTEVQTRRELTGKAMVVHLLAGQTERGVRLLNQLCRELGMMPVPERTWLRNLMLALLFLRYALGRRIAALPVPSVARAAPLDQQRAALCLLAARGFLHGPADHAAHFGVRSLLAIRRSRDPRNWPMGLAWEGLLRGLSRGASTEREQRAMARALELAEAQGDRETLAIVLATEGTRCMCTCQWEASQRAFERAEEALSASGRSVIPFFNGARAGRLAAWVFAGQMNQLLHHANAWIVEARALGDAAGELIVRVDGSYRFLALDDPAGMRESLAPLSMPGTETALYRADAWVFGDPLLYEGDAEGALAIYEQARRSVSFRAVQRSALHRTFCTGFLARAYLASEDPKRRATRLEAAARQARRLQRERFALAPAIAAHIRAAVAHARGDDVRALAELERAADTFSRTGTLLHAAAARHRAGLLRGGDEGAELKAKAERAAFELGVRSPIRWFRLLVPGFPD